MCIPKSKMIVLLCLFVIACAGSKAIAADDTITGEGTANYIPKFTDTYKVHNSTIYESSGNIGIGTASPVTNLNIVETGISGRIYIDVYSTNNAARGNIAMRKSAQDSEGLTTTGNGDSLGSFSWYGVDSGSSWSEEAGSITVKQNGTAGANYIPADMIFQTSTNAAKNTNQLVLHNTGNVGIGTAGPDYKLQITTSDQFPIYLQTGAGLLLGATAINGIVSTGSGANLGLGTNGASNLVTIQHGTGNVGIGTTGPDKVLHLRFSGSNGLKIESTSNNNAQLKFRTNSVDRAFLTANSNALNVGTESGTDLPILFSPNAAEKVRIDSSGNVGIGTSDPNANAKLTVRGNILIQDSNGIDAVWLGTGLDYSEGFYVSDKKQIMTGCVVVIDADNPGKLTVSTQPYDSKVAGIVAGAKGLGSGVRLGIDGFDCDVALAGRVYCNVDATEEAVQPGDLLTTSAAAGYAMKAADYTRAQGAILGKAMEGLEQGKKGQILVLVTLQ